MLLYNDINIRLDDFYYVHMRCSYIVDVDANTGTQLMSAPVVNGKFC